MNKVMGFRANGYSTIKVICSLLMSGLMVSGANVFADELPAWVLNPPADSNIYLYGVGDAESLAASKVSGLSDIASKLSISIASEVQTQDTLSLGQASSSYMQSVQAKVKALNFSNYEVDSVERVDGRFYALVKVSRNQVAEDLKIKIRDSQSKIDIQKERMSQLSNIEKYKALADLLPMVETINGDQAILSSVSGSTGSAAGSESPNKGLLKQYNDLRGNLLVVVNSSHKMRYLKEEIVGLLSELSIRASDAGPSNTIIEIKESINEQEAFGSKMVSLDALITLKNHTGSVIKSKRFSASGSSMSSYSGALKLAQTQIVEEIKSAGVLASLLGS